MAAIKEQDVISTAIEKYGVVRCTNIQLAKLASFTDEECKFVVQFWDFALNSRWILLTKGLIKKYMTESVGRCIPADFYRNNLVARFTSGEDYIELLDQKEIDDAIKNNLLEPDEYFDARGSKSRKYYLITGDCYKELLMKANTKAGRVVRKYFLKVEKLAIIMAKYLGAVQEIEYKQQTKLLENRLRESERTEKELEEEKKRAERKEQELEEEKKRAEQLEKETKKKDEEIKIRDEHIASLGSELIEARKWTKTCTIGDLSGFIYIGTTKSYAAKNYFKIGKTHNPIKRLQAYQNAHPSSEPFYFAYLKRVNMVDQTEASIKTLLKDFLTSDRPGSMKEYYTIHFDLLKCIIRKVCRGENAVHRDVVEALKKNLPIMNAEKKIPQEVKAFVKRKQVYTLRLQDGKVVEEGVYEPPEDDEERYERILDLINEIAAEKSVDDFDIRSEETIGTAHKLKISWSTLEPRLVILFGAKDRRDLHIMRCKAFLRELGKKTRAIIYES